MSIEEAIKATNSKIHSSKIHHLAHLISKYSTVNGLDSRLVAAIIAVESRFIEDAEGSLGEVGLMQLRPEYHATRIGNIKHRREHLFDVETNLYYGIKYLAGLKAVFEERYPDYNWITLYNCGPYGNPKTFKYTKKVLAYYRQFGGMK